MLVKHCAAILLFCGVSLVIFGFQVLWPALCRDGPIEFSVILAVPALLMLFFLVAYLRSAGRQLFYNN